MESALHLPPDETLAHKPSLLAASRATVDLFILSGSSDFSIKELASHAEISERTFYRYFPRKEDVVRPFLAAGLERVVAEFRRRPARETALQALEAVWLGSWPATDPQRSRVLHRILEEVDSLRAVLLQVVVDSELRWAEAIAERLGLPPGSPQAGFAGAVAVAAFRLAWKTFARDPDIAPAAAIAAHMRLLPAELFAPAGQGASRFPTEKSSTRGVEP